MGTKSKVVNKLTGRQRFHIIIEGTDEDQMRGFFEEIQNQYGLF